MGVENQSSIVELELPVRWGLVKMPGKISSKYWVLECRKKTGAGDIRFGHKLPRDDH